MNFKIVQSKEEYNCSIFSIVRERFQYGDREFERVTVDHPGASVFLPKTACGTYLLIRQYRASIREWLLEAAAGTLEVGEDPLECAKREIQEEVKYRADRWTPLGCIYPAPGFCNEKQHLFLAEDLTPAALQHDEDEHLEVVEYSEQELLSALHAGEVQDAKTIALLTRVLGGFRKND